MSNSVGVVCLSMLCFITSSYALRILIAIPMVAKSHSILGEAMAKQLTAAGHQVVYATPYPRKQNVPNLKEIDLSQLEAKIKAPLADSDQFKLKNMMKMSKGVESNMVYFISKKVHESLFEIDEFVQILGDPREKFDLVIAEWFFYDGIAGLASVLECPLVWFISFEATWNILELVDELPNPAYNVDILANYRPPLTFWQRITELWTIIQKKIFLRIFLSSSDRDFYNTVYAELAQKRGAKLQPYDDVIYNGSMLLINSHPSFGRPFRLPQNAKYIGGLHLDDKPVPLPKDLQNIMDSAKNGVIYFSMGSNLKSSDMSEKMINDILKMFGTLKQTVLWKFETKVDKLPANVHLLQWAPQLSILDHPNTKIFITHGGQLSTTEAIHYGVPVVGVPIMADQHVNMKTVETKGLGVTVEAGDDLADQLGAAIRELLQNPMYEKKAKEVSMCYHDRPVPPGREMLHWVEHAARTGGAPHLRSPALAVPWHQKMFLDLLIVVILILSVIVFSMKALYRTLFRGKARVTNVENKKTQ